MTAREQFLKDLQKDQDYIQHKNNCIWKDEVYSPYSGIYNKDYGSFHVASTDNDIYNNCNLIFSPLNSFA